MSHRHLYSSPQIFGSDQDQIWNSMYPDQLYAHLGIASPPENGSFVYPMPNMSIDGISFASNSDSTTMPNGFESSSLNIEVPPHQSDASGASHDHFLHSSSAAAFSISENYTQMPPPQLNYDSQAFHVVDGGYIDLTMGNGRGSHKRKSPGIAPVFERGSTSRYINGGTSSTELPVPTELQQEKLNMDSPYLPQDQVTMPLTFRDSGLSMRDNDSLRNVRSRLAPKFESNLAGTHLSGNHSHNYSPGLPIVHSSITDLSGQSSSGSTRQWNQMSTFQSHAHGRVILPDTSALNCERSPFLVGSGTSNHHDFGTAINPIAPQSSHNSVTQTARGVRINFAQRYDIPSRHPSSLPSYYEALSGDGLQTVADNYSLRHSRPLTRLSTIGWRNSDRIGRSRISSDRYRPYGDASGLQGRFSSEGFMIVDCGLPYGSRSMADQHRNMRMDIDNMSYEELLALGERIGHVNTGLSEDLISKCMIATIYCSSEQSQEEGNCAICLEEYKDMDDVGTMKTCRHDYHVSCIRKWLSMKKECPICKASALPDDVKDT